MLLLISFIFLIFAFDNLNVNNYIGTYNNVYSKYGQPWMPTLSTRICSAHFVGGVKSNDPRNLAYNPTIFPTPLESVKKRTASRVKWSTVESTSKDCGQGC
jgi:hypothetical protein